jgi:hypothetical protein
MKHKLAILLIVFAFALPTFAQDETPTAEGGVIVEPTALVTVEPTVEVILTPEPTPEPAPPADPNVLIPYGLVALVVGILAFASVAGGAMYLLFKSQPIAWAVARPLADAGVDAYGNYVKTTPDKYDDESYAALRREWEAFKLKMSQDVAAELTAQSQKLDSVVQSQRLN